MRSPEQILREARTIAVVGASPDPGRASYGVLRYLERAGYRCLPVNPQWDAAAPSLLDLDEHVDLVDVFRRPDFCPEVARQAVEIGAPALWLQLGIRSAEARAIAEAAGLDYVEDACTAVVHRRLG